MTVTINGMTLEEIEAQMKKFKKMEEENKKDFKVNCPIKVFMDPVYFTPREEIEFAKKMGEALRKAMDECRKKCEAAAEADKKDIQAVCTRICDVEIECDRALNRGKCFGGYFIWNKGDKM